MGSSYDQNTGRESPQGNPTHHEVDIEQEPEWNDKVTENAEKMLVRNWKILNNLCILAALHVNFGNMVYTMNVN